MLGVRFANPDPTPGREPQVQILGPVKGLGFGGPEVESVAPLKRALLVGWGIQVTQHKTGKHLLAECCLSLGSFVHRDGEQEHWKGTPVNRHHDVFLCT